MDVIEQNLQSNDTLTGGSLEEATKGLLGSDANIDESNNDDNPKINNDDQPLSEEELFNKEYIGKPESYDYKEIELPEGYELNTELTGKFNDVASRYNMSQKGANEIMSMAVDLAKQTQETIFSQIANQTAERMAQYEKTIKADKEIGGADFEKNIGVANIAYDKFLDRDAQALFQETGLSSHPSVVKMFFEIGKLMKEDTVHHAGVTIAEKSRAELLYPNM